MADRTFDLTLFEAPKLKGGRRTDGTPRDGSKSDDVVWPTRGHGRSFTMDRICTLLTTPIRAPAKFRLPFYVPGKLQDNARGNDKVLHLSMLSLDIEGGPTPDDVDLRFGDWARVLYTSWSHSPETPRMRLVLPLSRDVDATEYHRLWRWAAERLGTGVDMQTSDPTRVYFLPALREYAVRWEDDGPDLLDPDSVLSPQEAAPTWQDRSQQRVSSVVERRVLFEDEDLTLVTQTKAGKVEHFKLGDWAEDAEEGDKVKVACPFAEDATVGSAFVTMGEDRVRLTCMSSGHGHTRNEGASSWSVVWHMDAQHASEWTGGSADRWVARRVLSAVPSAHRARVAAEIKSRGWSTLVLPDVCGAVARAWVEWRSLVKNVVPIGFRANKLLFYRVNSNTLAELSLSDAGKVVRLASMMGDEWAALRNHYGLKEGKNGPYVAESEAVRRLQEVLGLLCSTALEESTAGDGLHVTPGAVHVVTSAGTYRRIDEGWERVVPPVVGSELARGRGVVHGRPSVVPKEQVREALGAVRGALGGWGFEEQAWTVAYMTGLAFALPVLSEMPLDPPWVSFRAPTRSGKTKLCRFLEGLTGWVHLAGQSTAYALARALDRSGAAVILDDVEGTRSGARSRDEIMGALRSGRFTRGNLSSQGYVDYMLRNPLIHAGIHDPTHDQDRNRFLELRFIRRKGHPDPEATAGKVAHEYRHVAQWAVLSDLDGYREAYDAARSACVVGDVEPRYARNLIPAMAVYLWAGGDWAREAAALVDNWQAGVPGTESRGEALELDFCKLLLEAPLRWSEEDDGGNTSTREMSLSTWAADRFTATRNAEVSTVTPYALPLDLGGAWYDFETDTLRLALVPGALMHVANRHLGYRVERSTEVRRLLESHPGYIAHSQRVRMSGRKGQVRATVLALPGAELLGD